MRNAAASTHRRARPRRGGSPNKPPLAVTDFAADLFAKLSAARTRAFLVGEFVNDFFARKVIGQRIWTRSLSESCCEFQELAIQLGEIWSEC
jgi:hypothetical protein